MIQDFMEIHIEDDELVTVFNLRFAKTLKRIPQGIRPLDDMDSVVYLGAFGKNMSYRMRNESPESLYEAYEIKDNIEKVSKFGMSRKLKPKKRDWCASKQDGSKVRSDF